MCYGHSMAERKSAATLKTAQAAYLAKQREQGAQLSPRATSENPGVRLQSALDQAKRLFKNPS